MAGALTPTESKSTTIVGEDIRLETIQEIITKKVFYRGASIKPRDIFDIAAVAERHSDQLVAALRPYKEQAQVALSAIDKLNPEFTRQAIEALAIFEPFRPLVQSACKRTRDLLAVV